MISKDIVELPGSDPDHTPNNDAASPNCSRDDPTALLKLGAWVTVLPEAGKAEEEWLACISGIGSNFVQVREPGDSYKYIRIHLNKAWDRLNFISEDEAKAHIEERVQHFRLESSATMSRIAELSRRLGISTSNALPFADSTSTPGTALATMSAQPDIEGYKTALIEAKDKTLPALFEDLKRANEGMAIWLSASTLPLMLQAGELSEYVGEVKDKIFSISLYAGLIESLVKVCDGEPAAMQDKLHVMQRRFYMDEECLANYQAGGMSFKEIEQFDEWLSKPENRDRVLPFPRTIVAMKVRRHAAEREYDGSALAAHINFQLEQGDRLTFLYIRNGDQIWRLSTEIEFGEMIFPDQSVYDPAEPMMAKRHGSRIDRFMKKSEYDNLSEGYAKAKAAYDQWFLDNPYEEWVKGHPGESKFSWERDMPYEIRSVVELGGFNPSEWHQVDQSFLYYDEAMDKIGEEVKQYNRIATIIQGVFDRSLALHPHPPVQTWTPGGFEAAIKLVYDASLALHGGEPPDIEAYIAGCNTSIGPGSFVTGQVDAWLRREAIKEMQRRQKDYRMSDGYRYAQITRYRPFGDPGPENIAEVVEWKPRAKSVVFNWYREAKSYRGPDVRCSITVPVSALFNVSAYKPGDFRRFYQDSRTRAQYLKWAPMLLAAEDWWQAKEVGGAG